MLTDRHPTGTEVNGWCLISEGGTSESFRHRCADRIAAGRCRVITCHEMTAVTVPSSVPIVCVVLITEVLNHEACL